MVGRRRNEEEVVNQSQKQYISRHGSFRTTLNYVQDNDSDFREQEKNNCGSWEWQTPQIPHMQPCTFILFHVDRLCKLTFDFVVVLSQCFRYLTTLKTNLPSISPVDAHWPSSSLMFRKTNALLKDMYHAWRVS